MPVLGWGGQHSPRRRDIIQTHLCNLLLVLCLELVDMLTICVFIARNISSAQVSLIPASAGSVAGIGRCHCAIGWYKDRLSCGHDELKREAKGVSILIQKYAFWNLRGALDGNVGKQLGRVTPVGC